MRPEMVTSRSAWQQARSAISRYEGCIGAQTVARQDDAALMRVERCFLYMPFEHAETMSAQEQSVNLFARLEAESGMADLVVWAERHAAVIRRFGRFPHRNAILGRASTPEEVA